MLARTTQRCFPHAQVSPLDTVDDLCARVLAAGGGGGGVVVDLSGAILAGATDASVPGAAHVVATVQPVLPSGEAIDWLDCYAWQPVSARDVPSRMLCADGAAITVKNGELRLPPHFQMLVDSQCTLESLVVRGALLLNVCSGLVCACSGYSHVRAPTHLS
jgi:phage tail protein X